MPGRGLLALRVELSGLSTHANVSRHIIPQHPACREAGNSISDTRSHTHTEQMDGKKREKGG